MRAFQQRVERTSTAVSRRNETVELAKNSWVGMAAKRASRRRRPRRRSGLPAINTPATQHRGTGSRTACGSSLLTARRRLSPLSQRERLRHPGAITNGTHRAAGTNSSTICRKAIRDVEASGLFRASGSARATSACPTAATRPDSTRRWPQTGASGAVAAARRSRGLRRGGYGARFEVEGGRRSARAAGRTSIAVATAFPAAAAPRTPTMPHPRFE